MLWNLIIASLDVTKSSHKMILLFPALYVSFFVCILLFYFILKAQHCTAATAWTRE